MKFLHLARLRSLLPSHYLFLPSPSLSHNKVFSTTTYTTTLSHSFQQNYKNTTIEQNRSLTDDDLLLPPVSDLSFAKTGDFIEIEEQNISLLKEFMNACKDGNVRICEELKSEYESEYKKLLPCHPYYSAYVSLLCKQGYLDRAIPLVEDELANHPRYELEVAPYLIYYYNAILSGLCNYQERVPKDSMSLFGPATRPWFTSPTLDDCLDFLKYIEKEKNVKPDLYSYCLILNCFFQYQQPEKALQYLYEELLDEQKGKTTIVSNIVILGVMIRGLCHFGKLNESFDLIQYFEKNYGIQPNSIIHTCIVSAYCKASRVDEAFSYMNGEMIRPHINHYHVTTIIKAYFDQANPDAAHRIFNEFMADKQVKDSDLIHLYNAMITGYCNHDRLHDAISLFKRMKNKNLITFNILINAYCRRSKGNVEPGVELIKQMEKLNIEPDEQTIHPILHSYAISGQIEKALDMIDYMYERYGLTANIMTYHSIMKNTDFNKALQIFEFIKSHDTLRPVRYTYNIMMEQYISQGNLDKAIELMSEMLTLSTQEGTSHSYTIQPNEITFSQLIKACSANGDIKMVDYYFNLLQTKLYNNKKVHNASANARIYGLMIHAYCKLKTMQDALEMFKKGKNELGKADYQMYYRLIRGYCFKVDTESAEFWLQEMINDGIQPKIDIINSVMSSYIARKKYARVIDIYKRFTGGEFKIMPNRGSVGIVKTAEYHLNLSERYQ